MKRIQSLKSSTAVAHRAITTADIQAVREALLGNEKCMSLLPKFNAIASKDVHEAFLSTNALDKELVKALNSLSGEELLDATAISKLSYKMKAYRLQKPYAMFYIVEANINLAKTILNVLGDLGIIGSKTIHDDFWLEGKRHFKSVRVHNFGKSKVKDELYGLHFEPGQVPSKTIHVKPGGVSLKLSKTQKEFNTALSSMKFRLVRTDEKTLQEYFEQTKWYRAVVEKQEANSRLAESPFQLRKRVKRYISEIMALMEHDELYLSNWYDSRLRLYYDLTMMGINPHGDAFETHMWELAEPKKINKVGFEGMCHAVVTIATGKRHAHDATLKLYARNEDKYLKTIVDPKHYQTSEGVWDKGGYGEWFYGCRLVQAVADYKSGKPSYFMLGEDATNGGLQHAGIGFRSIKSMKAANVGGLKSIQDSHKTLADAFGLDRDVAKKVNQPLLHGSTWKTAAESLSAKTGRQYSVDEVIAHSIEAYGPEIMNVPAIADWGSTAYDTSNPSLMWKTFDGEKAQSTAFFENVEIDAYGLSLSAKNGYTSTTVHRDMPILLDNKGRPVYDNAKMRGLYANITHSTDATVLRHVAHTMIRLNRTIMFKHDKFYAHPNDTVLIRKSYKSALLDNFDYQPYHRAIEQVAHNHTDKSLANHMPDLLVGEGTKSMIEKSEGFLQA